jgi:hypothetical protein
MAAFVFASITVWFMFAEKFIDGKREDEEERREKYFLR